MRFKDYIGLITFWFFVKKKDGKVVRCKKNDMIIIFFNKVLKLDPDEFISNIKHFYNV